MGILASLGLISGLLSFAFFYFLYLDIASFMFLLLDYIAGYFSWFMFIHFSLPFALYFSLVLLFCFRIE